MIEVRAHLKHARISSRKMRLVADMIRGLPAGEAVRRLQLVNKRAAPLVLTTLKSAMANAANNANLQPDTMIIKKIVVNQGVALKRFRPAAMGAAHQYKKHGSHLEIVLTAAIAPQESSKKVAEPAKEATVKTKPVAKKVVKAAAGVKKASSQAGQVK
ncbi:MAG: 50S ribosomal protein L22 [Candidatus Komeilibacteria bacterium]